ncbi:MAG: 40S ribosomal protein S25 [Terriglobus roseus]|nr:40S ribosomal protein S25 [Terriglobus roseus]
MRKTRLVCLFLRIEQTNADRTPCCTVKDKANHAVVFDKTTSEKLQKDVQSYRLITVAVLVDRLKINGSLARQALADLEEKGVIKPVVKHSKCSVYSKDPCPALH